MPCDECEFMIRPRFNSACAALLISLGAIGCRDGNDGVGVPTAIVVVSGGNQEATVGTSVPQAPTVRVTDGAGNAIAGVTVRFAIIDGGGSVIGDSLTTDGNGNAMVGQWILGTAPGINTLRASIPSTTLSTNITATAVVGGGVVVRATGALAYVALVGQTVAPAPAVKVLDSFGNPVQDVAVTFTVAQGGGSVTGATVITNSNGIATVGSWTVGSTTGVNLLSASVTSGSSITFTAQALTSAPVLTATSPLSQAGFLSASVGAIPRIRVTDAAGHSLSGVPVTFASTGDGVVIGGAAVSDVDGIAAPTDWRMGATATTTMVASTGLGAAPVTFTATGVPAPFLIDVRFLTTISPDTRDAFVTAARRWMRIITGHLNTVTVNLPAGTCSTRQPSINESITDVVIFAEVTPIDGPSNILGSAGPCAVRSVTELPLVGSMQFDEADLDLLASTNRLVATITHEMAHVLGFGTIWSSRSVTSGTGGADPIFVGSEALSVWPPFASALSYTGQPVPLENSFGVGTRDVHWRESVFHAELMTGFIEAPGVPMPLSKVTIASMHDLGYLVDESQADLFAGNLVDGAALRGPAMQLNERVITPKFVVTPFGQLVQRSP